MIPKNEQETIALFSQLSKELGYTFKELGTRCPDAILQKAGQSIRVEFEYVARNFEKHKHNPSDVDLIICWEDDWPECALPVLSLQNYITLAKPLPRWQRFLAWLRDYRIVAMQYRNEVRANRAKGQLICRVCGSQMEVSCSSVASTKGEFAWVRDCYANQIVRNCPNCGFRSQQEVRV